MESISPFLIALLVFLTTVLIRWVAKRRQQFRVFERYGIPGPKPDFWTGNLSQIGAAPTRNDAISGWLKEYGDVFGYFVGETPFVVIKDLDMLKQVFIKDLHVFHDRPPLPITYPLLDKALVMISGRRWKEMRSILTPTFSTAKIKLMTRLTSKKVDITVSVVAKKAESNEMFDIYNVVQGLTLDVIADCALAMQVDSQNNPQDILKLAVNDFFRFNVNTAKILAILFPCVSRVMTFVNQHMMTSGMMTTIIVDNVRKIIRFRKKNPEFKRTDFLQLLLHHSDNGLKSTSKLTKEEIVANAYAFLLAGYETTSTALAFTFYLLIKNPDIQERLYMEIKETEDDGYNSIQNLKYLDQVLSESLRRYPPLPGFVSRNCDTDHKIGDSLTIPKGVNVVAPVWDIHHDPDLWPDPWTFDPDRFSPDNRTSLNSMAYMPFGVGPRNCIGQRFALLEAKLAVFKLLKRFRFEMCEKTDDPLTLENSASVINPKYGVFLRAVPRTENI